MKKRISKKSLLKMLDSSNYIIYDGIRYQHKRYLSDDYCSMEERGAGGVYFFNRSKLNFCHPDGYTTLHLNDICLVGRIVTKDVLFFGAMTINFDSNQSLKWARKILPGVYY